MPNADQSPLLPINPTLPIAERKPEIPAAPAGPPPLRETLKKQGLSHGRVVEYVTLDGTTRAATVAFVHTNGFYADKGAVNLTVHDLDGNTYAAADVPYEGHAQPHAGGTCWRWPKRS